MVPTDLSPENGQKPVFLHFGSFKNWFLWFLNGPSPPGDIAECWKTFSSITICNIKSIPQTKLQKMTKNFIFGSLDHSNMHSCDFWMILPNLAAMPNVEEHLDLSKSAISSQSNRPNSRKGPKTLFLALWIIQNCIFWLLNDPAWAISAPNC